MMALNCGCINFPHDSDDADDGDRPIAYAPRLPHGRLRAIIMSCARARYGCQSEARKLPAVSLGASLEQASLTTER